MDLSAEKLARCESESLDEVYIEDFPGLSFAEGRAAFQEAFRVLRHGGVCECSAADMFWFLRRYMALQEVDAEMNDVVARVCAFWTEKVLARELLIAGFHKVWTGVVPERPISEVTAKALKFTSPSVGTEGSGE